MLIFGLAMVTRMVVTVRVIVMVVSKMVMVTMVPKKLRC